MDILPADKLCNTKLFERFAHFLADVYRKPKGTKGQGGLLNWNTAIGYFNSALQQITTLHRDNINPVIREFLTASDPNCNTEARRWCVKVRCMVRDKQLRIVEAGEELDTSPPPIKIAVPFS